ncbi:hypothetical protein BDR04DRAFT_1117540 [Suillus decipiens]|nr:hypothetical protein BDR04DRAFT_1117540 [Suillus decipiens]
MCALKLLLMLEAADLYHVIGPWHIPQGAKAFVEGLTLGRVGVQFKVWVPIGLDTMDKNFVAYGTLYPIECIAPWFEHGSPRLECGVPWLDHRAPRWECRASELVHKTIPHVMWGERSFMYFSESLRQCKMTLSVLITKGILNILPVYEENRKMHEDSNPG